MDKNKTTVTIDNLVYDINALPDEIRSVLILQQDWVSERSGRLAQLRTAQNEIDKLSFAINGINAQLVAMIRNSNVPPIKDLNEKPEQPAEQ